MAYLFPILIGLGCSVILLRLIFWNMPKPKPVACYGTDDGQADVQPTIKSSRDNITFERIRREQRVHTFGKRTLPPVRKPTISLTPRMVERVNTQRKLRGMPPFNRTGIKAAVATASVEQQTYGNRQPSTNNEWLTYLILYQCFLSDHQSHTVGGVGGLTIDPNVPFNGMEMGGTFGGAGASGDWTSAPDSVMSAVADVAPQPGPGDGIVNSYQNNPDYSFDTKSDPAPSASDPSPSYSAPDPSPSYSAPDASAPSSSDGGGGGGGGDGS